jgi:hypothetical protein
MSGTLDAIILLAALAGGILWEMVKIRQILERMETRIESTNEVGATLTDGN